MSTAADSIATKVDGVSAGATVSSPKSRRSLQAPWAQIVRGVEPLRGVEPEPISVSSPRSPSPSPEKISLFDCSAQKPTPENSSSDAPPESSDSNDGNVGTPKKPVWNKPINGVVEAVTVMGGAISWPALSESTRPSPKSSTDLSKPIPDGSTAVSQGPMNPQSPQKQANANVNTNSNANPTTPGRQRSMKHRGSNSNNSGAGTGGPAGGAFIRAPPPTPPPLPPPFPVMPYGNLVPPVLEPPVVRGPRPVGGFPSQPHAAGDHSPHRNHARRGNFGGRPRGNGSYHNNHRGRPDQDRRDAPLAPPPAGFIPTPPLGSGPFLQHPHVRPFVGPPIGYDMHPLFYGPTLPIVNQGPPPPPLYFPSMDPNLVPALLKQIEYYFSDDNLVKDEFLRSYMDEEGWVPVKLIANFRRVKNLTEDVQFILYCLRSSTVVEVQGEKVRRRDDWRKWTHTSARVAADSGSSSTPAALTDSVLTTPLQNVSLNEPATNNSVTEATSAQVEVAAGGLSDDLTNPSKPAQEEGNTEEISSGQA